MSHFNITFLLQTEDEMIDILKNIFLAYIFRSYLKCLTPCLLGYSKRLRNVTVSVYVWAMILNVYKYFSNISKQFDHLTFLSSSSIPWTSITTRTQKKNIFWKIMDKMENRKEITKRTYTLTNVLVYVYEQKIS